MLTCAGCAVRQSRFFRKVLKGPFWCAFFVFNFIRTRGGQKWAQNDRVGHMGRAYLRGRCTKARDSRLERRRFGARTLYPHCYTPQVCKAKYEDLQMRYSGSNAWFEELKRRPVAELKQELAKSEDSIGSLESKIKSMEADKQHSNQADHGSSQTEPPSPVLNSNGTETSSKEISKDGNSAGSLTKDTSTSTSWLYEHQNQDIETNTKPDISVSSDNQDKDLSISKLAEGNYGQGLLVKKRRGQRKRKDCNRVVKEGSVCESDNLGSSNVVSNTQKETSTNDCGQIVGDHGVGNCNGGPLNVKRDDSLMEIFKSIAQSDPASVFRHRMDSQKRARYRKLIKQHLDIGTIRSRIIGQSIKSAKELFRHLLLLSNNALVFYSRRTREYKSGLCLRNLVMKEYNLHCRGLLSHEATSAFLPFNPPGKPGVLGPTLARAPQHVKIRPWRKCLILRKLLMPLRS